MVPAGAVRIAERPTVPVGSTLHTATCRGGWCGQPHPLDRASQRLSRPKDGLAVGQGKAKSRTIRQRKYPVFEPIPTGINTRGATRDTLDNVSATQSGPNLCRVKGLERPPPSVRRDCCTGFDDVWHDVPPRRQPVAQPTEPGIGLGRIFRPARERARSRARTVA